MSDSQDKQPDLFPVYPDVPGARATDTSMAAADHAAERAPTLRDMVLGVIAAAPDGMTADEAAAALDENPFTIRPRVTELNKMVLIKDSGRRRQNASGREAIVWIVREGGA